MLYNGTAAVHQTANVTVAVNGAGKVITVIPKWEDRAKFIYSIKDGRQSTMTLTIDTYAKTINISVRYSDNTIFAGEYDEVLEIRKSEDVLIVETENKKRLVLKKYPCLGIVLESE